MANKAPEQVEPPKKHCVKGALNILGEHDAMLYHIDDVSRNLEPIPDDFFDVTQEDARRIYSDIIQKRNDLENAPLTTKETKALEKDAAILQNIKLHPVTLIRIRFPSRHVLQGTFRSIDSLSAIVEFVKHYLNNPKLEFYLFTAPPKKILPHEGRLIEESLVGCAVIYFGSNETADNYIKPEYLAQLSDPEAVNNYLRNRGSRGKPRLDPSSMDSSDLHSQAPHHSQHNQGESSQAQAKRPMNSDKNKIVPKWFKK